jgi:hypothetical protein
MAVLAEARSARGDYAGARAAAARSLEMARSGEVLGGHSAWIGLAQLELGVALAGQGEAAAAREALQHALEHLSASVGSDAPSTRRAVAQLERLGT